MPKKHLYEDKELQDEFLKGYIEVLKQVKPDLKEEEFYNSINDPNKIKAYKIAVESEKIQQQQFELGTKLEEELKNEGFTVKMNPGLKRSYMFRLKLEDTEEAKKYNRQLMLDCCDPEKAKQMVINDLKTVLNADKKILFPSSIEEALENYDKYADLLNTMFVIDSEISNGGFSLFPEAKELLQDSTLLIQTASNYKAAVKYASNPFYLVTPKLDFEKAGELVVATAFSTPLLKKYGDKIEGIKINGEVGNETSPTMGEFFSSIMDINANFEPTLKIGKLFDEKKVPNKIINEIAFKENGIKLNYYEGLEKLANDPNSVTVEKVSEEQKLKNNAAIEKPLYNSGAIVNNLNAIKILSQALNKEHGLFTRKTPEFDKMQKALNSFVKKYDSFDAVKYDAGKFTELFEDCKNTIESCQNYLNIKANQKQNTIRKNRVDIVTKLVDKLDMSAERKEMFGLTEAEKLHEDYLKRQASGVYVNQAREQIEIPSEEIEAPVNNQVEKNIEEPTAEKVNEISNEK